MLSYCFVDFKTAAKFRQNQKGVVAAYESWADRWADAWKQQMLMPLTMFWLRFLGEPFRILSGSFCPISAASSQVTWLAVQGGSSTRSIRPQSMQFYRGIIWHRSWDRNGTFQVGWTLGVTNDVDLLVCWYHFQTQATQGCHSTKSPPTRRIWWVVEVVVMLQLNES